VAGGTIYMENIDFVGSSAEGFTIGNTAGAVVGYFNNCTFRFAVNNGLASTASATTYFYNCVASKNGDDGFNYHKSTGTVPYSVEINCTGRDNGAAGDIDNGSTMHDGGSIVRIMGEYARNVGRNVHDVTSGTTSWNLGCYAHDSTSAVNDINWAAGTGGSDTAKMWLDCCNSSGSATDIEADTQAAVYIRNFTGGGVYSGTPTAY
jgi:hypothetical protein